MSPIAVSAGAGRFAAASILSLVSLCAAAAQCREFAGPEIAGVTSFIEWPDAEQSPYYAVKAGDTVHVREKATHRDVLRFERRDGHVGARMHPTRPRVLLESIGNASSGAVLDRREYQMREIPSGQPVGPVLRGANQARFVGDRHLELWRFTDGKLGMHLVDIESGREIARAPWFAVVDAADGPALVAHPSVDGRRTVVVDLGSAREVATLGYDSQASGRPTSALIGDARLALASIKDGVVQIYDLAGGREVETLPGYASVYRRGGLVFLGGGERGVDILDAASGRSRLALPSMVGHVAQAAIDRDGRLVSVVTYPQPANRQRTKDQATVLWDPSRVAEIGRYPWDGMLSSTGSFVALYQNRGAVMALRIVEAASGREVCSDEFNAHGSGFARSLTGNLVAVSGLREGGRDRVLFLDLARAGSAQAAAARPAGDARLIFSEAFTAFQRGDFDAAARRFQEGLAIDSANAPAHYYLGETYLRQSKRAEAVVAFRRARELAPGSREADQAAERLAQLRIGGAPGPAGGAVSAIADPEHVQLLVRQAISRGSLGSQNRRYRYIDGTWNESYFHAASLDGLMVAAEPTAGDMLIDLDSGNAAVPLYAALRFGLRAVGVMQDTDSVRRAEEAARALGIADRVGFVVGDPLEIDLAGATIVTLNGTLRDDPELNRRFAAKLRALPKTVRIAASNHNQRRWNWVPDRLVTAMPGGKGYVSPTALWLGRGER